MEEWGFETTPIICGVVGRREGRKPAPQQPLYLLWEGDYEIGNAKDEYLTSKANKKHMWDTSDTIART